MQIGFLNASLTAIYHAFLTALVPLGVPTDLKIKSPFTVL